jgi:hypothetical protein
MPKILIAALAAATLVGVVFFRAASMESRGRERPDNPIPDVWLPGGQSAP